MSSITPTAEPFFFPGKDGHAATGCLVTHGFTGAPKEMRGLGEHLHGLGYTVCGIRLTGHATQPTDMIRSRRRDWLLSVEDGFNYLSSSCRQVFLLGLSMGGILSLISAAHLPVAGVVAMSTPWELPHARLMPVARLLSVFMPYMKKSKGTPGADWFDQQAFHQHVSYPMNPVRSAYELYQLMREMHTTLPSVKVPVLLIHSHDDSYVDPASMEKIHAALGSHDKHMLWVQGGSHVITEEPTCQAVFTAAEEFIARVAAK
jgi:carboxylesterase